MTEFLLYFEVNIICILVLAIIGFNIKYSEYSPGRRPRVLTKLISFTIGFYILDILGGYNRIYKLATRPTLVYIITAAYFLFFAISAYIWFFYSEILHNKDFFDKKRKHIILALPIVLLAVLLAVSYFNGCLFSVTTENGYARGPLFALQAMVSFAYIFIAGIRCLYFAKKNKKSSSYRDLVTFAIYSFITVICGILQFAIGEFPILMIGDTTSIFLLYLHYLRNMISLDPLTQIPNRRKFLYQTNELEKTLRPNENLYFMFVDVDSFKSINDKYGHIEGDRVLEEISHIIRKFTKKYDCFCGRFGGDEFAIVQKLSKRKGFESPEEIYSLIENKGIKTPDGTPVTVSIGYAKFAPDDSINDLVSRADKSMYEVKIAKKSGGGVTLLGRRIKVNNFGKPFERMGRKVKYLTGFSV